MLNIDRLQQHFGSRLQHNVRLANYTTSRVGGEAPCLLVAHSSVELAADVQYLWQNNDPVKIFGSGSNMLVSDHGLEAVVVVNKTKAIRFEKRENQPVVYAESGATLITVARQTAENGYDGMVWASTIPGTVGGAVYGNAGAHGSDTSLNLAMAEILHREKGRVSLDAEAMQYAYRSSFIKRNPGSAVILAATFALRPADPQVVKAAMAANAEKRRLSQPTGSCMGSMFKNPEGDKAGRLIEAAGLKGMKIGGVEISPKHANFMINDGTGTAQDYRRLIELTQNAVFEKFGVKLSLEIEIIGEWQE